MKNNNTAPISNKSSHPIAGYNPLNFTNIPDEFFDRYMVDLGLAELRTLLYIFRRTFGFKKFSDDISISQMLNGIVTHDGRWKRNEDFKQNLMGLTIFIRRLTSQAPLNNLLNRRNAPTLQKCIDNKEVIIIRAGGYPNTIGASLGLLFQISLQEYIEHRDVTGSTHLLALYMDELPMYLNDNFQTLVSTSRKQHVSLFLGFQSMKQLYPLEDVITGNVRTWFVHSSLGYEECEYISKTIGETVVMVHSSNVPYDVRQGAGNQLLSPTIMRKLPPEEVRRISQDKLLLLTTNPLKPREADEHRFIIKPSLDSLNQAVAIAPYEYKQPVIPSYPGEVPHA